MPDETPSTPPGHRAHLTARDEPAPPIYRYPAAPALADLVRHFWIPVWRLPAGEIRTQRVLQYPVCNIVIAQDYARFYGPNSGLSTVDLSGAGWAVGVMLQPAAGRILWDRPVATITDGNVPVEQLTTVDGASLRDLVRNAMADDPGNETSHRLAIATIENALEPLLPVDEEGKRVNRLVEMVETDPTIVRVEQLATELGTTERSLQRLTKDRLGLTPKWLIQRRRLHDAVSGIKTGPTSLADLAYTLGYADQAHFTRDFTKATGMTPSQYLASQGTG